MADFILIGDGHRLPCQIPAGNQYGSFTQLDDGRRYGTADNIGQRSPDQEARSHNSPHNKLDGTGLGRSGIHSLIQGFLISLNKLRCNVCKGLNGIPLLGQYFHV
ncbi:hypothetical protein D3C72_1966850 [compost metagenome]